MTDEQKEPEAEPVVEATVVSTVPHDLPESKIMVGSAERAADFMDKGPAMVAMATKIAKSGQYKTAKTPEAAVAIMLTAYEMDIPISSALRGLYSVRGKLEMETWLMAGLAVSKCGVTWTDEEVGPRRVRLTLHRAGWEDKPVEFSLEHAQQAGNIRDLNPETGEFKQAGDKGNYVKATEEMLYWRALSKGIKRIAPDYFGGVYSMGELAVEAAASIGGRPAGASDLEALMKGVEPDPLVMYEDEIAAVSKELHEAVKLEVVTRDARKRILGLIERGSWATARESLDGVRSLVLDELERRADGQS
jgi:hypothetical protein